MTREKAHGKEKTKRTEATGKAGPLPCGRPRPLGAAASQSLLPELVGKLESYCDRNELRKSSTRNRILETIIELRHFTPQDLYMRMLERHPDIGRATLYRTLPILVEAGILEEGPKTVDGPPSYELATSQHHDHVVCLDCREVFEFSSPKIEAEQERIVKSLGFAPRKHTHVIYAQCTELASRKQRGC